MSYNTKNYTEQGGEKTVIGGTLEFGPEGKVVNFPEASKTTVGGVKAAANLEDCQATIPVLPIPTPIQSMRPKAKWTTKTKP